MVSLQSPLELERLAHPEESEAACVRASAARVIDELGITEPPVDVEMVASMLDIGTLVRDWDLDVAGCLMCRASGPIIVVRAGDAERRQRFTICHECAHTFFPGFWLATQYRCSPRAVVTTARPGLEQLCDIAASELLLPRQLFVPRAQAADFSLQTVEDLARAFRASLAATANTFVSSSREPVAVLALEVMQKPAEYGTSAEPKLRLKSAVRTGAWPLFLRYKSASPNDPFDRANQGEIVNETGFTLTGLVTVPINVDLHAQPYPYFDGTTERQRVIGLIRQTTRRSTIHV